MAAYEKQIQFLRGSSTACASYTGLAGQLLVDTTKKTLRVLDGTTAGGSVLVNEARKLKTDSENLLKFNAAAEADLSADVSVTVDKTALAAKLVSTKANNAIKIANATGEDNLLYADSFDIDALVGSDEKVLYVKNASGVKTLATNLQFDYDKLTGKLTVKGGSDGTTLIKEMEIPTSLTLLKTAEVVTDPAGQDPGTYLHFVFSTQAGAGHDTADVYVDVTDFIDVYTAGDGLQLNASDDHKFEVKIASAGNLLKLDSSKALFVPTDFGTLD